MMGIWYAEFPPFMFYLMSKSQLDGVANMSHSEYLSQTKKTPWIMGAFFVA